MIRQESSYANQNILWIMISQCIWGVVAAFGLLTTVLGIMPRFLQLQQIGILPQEGSGYDEIMLEQQFRHLGAQGTLYAGYVVGVEAFVAVAFFTTAWVMYWYHASHQFVWLVSLMLIAFGTSIPGMSNALLIPWTASWWDFSILLLRACASISSVTFFYLFPNGTFFPSWTRWFAYAWVMINGVWLFWPHLLPFNILHGKDWSAHLAVSLIGIAALAFSGIYSLIRRFQTITDPLERHQVIWVGLGLGGAVVGGILYHLPVDVSEFVARRGISLWTYDLIVITIAALLILLVPISISYAILRYELWGVLVRRTVVYVLLSTVLLSIYAGTLLILGLFFQSWGSTFFSTLATVVAAVCFQPLRLRIRRIVLQQLFGNQDDPLQTLQKLGLQLQATITPIDLPDVIVTTIATVLRLPYAAVFLEVQDRWMEVGSWGEPSQEVSTIPLVYQSMPLGKLVVGSRIPGETFNSNERALLALFAQQASPALHVLRLSADLRVSREQIVLSREAERRHISENLHNGLGPFLASLTLKAARIAKFIRQNPDLAFTLVKELSTELHMAVHTVRDLSHQLRPLTLDELGLHEAIKLLIEEQRDDDLLSISFEMFPDTPDVAPALELAIYRIVQESVINVKKHARAQRCEVRISITDVATIEIMDNGIGVPSHVFEQLGIGLRSMRARAEELNGDCLVEARPTGGTRVYVVIPNGEEARYGSYSYPNR